MSRHNRQRVVRNSVSRRQFLGRAGAFTGAVVIGPSILAACGGDDDDATPATEGGDSGGAKSIKISNWTGYMDDAVLAKFQRDTGITVSYTEDIDDNEATFQKLRPNLSKGQSTGCDGFAFTDWMVSRLINQVDPPWVQKLDQKVFVNRTNIVAALAAPAFDPDRSYSVPWASGITGIAYNIKQTGKEIRTMDEFLAVAGAKTVLTEMRDTVGLFMQSSGADPSIATIESATPAFDALERAVNDGRIDGFNGNEYVNDLGAGNLAAAIAWSGDVAQITLDNPDVRFAIPDSGGNLWSDNFVIPVGTDKVDLASEWLNFFYDPVNAAALTATIQFVSPVEGVADELLKLGGDAAALVDNPLVVPTAEFLENVKIFGTLDAEAEAAFNERFTEILGAG